MAELHANANRRHDARANVRSTLGPVALAGHVEFSINPKSVEGSRTFAHAASNGTVRGAGTRTGTDLSCDSTEAKRHPRRTLPASTERAETQGVLCINSAGLGLLRFAG